MSKRIRFVMADVNAKDLKGKNQKMNYVLRNWNSLTPFSPLENPMRASGSRQRCTRLSFPPRKEK
jgi:hypothetical protein